LLSYRHAFHAGNHADVLKHLTLMLTLDYYCQKDKPFWYIDTHAGAGIYALHSEEAQKTREYVHGIQTLLQAPQPPEAIVHYRALVQQLNPPQKLLHYPGSPWIAAQCVRSSDSLYLFELHPTDAQHLRENFQHHKRVHINQQDGLKGLSGLLPPSTRRAVTLIDPSYELKSDYNDVITTLCKAHKRLANGTYLLWYPVITRQRVTTLLRDLQQSGIPDILQLELCISADHDGLGMTGSGLFIINPPWTLAQQMRALLPWLQQQLAQADGHYTICQITPEKT
jgi:23S rRNA (adenine2030-N6)-methyltransferase